MRTATDGGGVVGFVLGALFIALGVGRFTLERQRRAMARKLRGFERVLDAPSLFAVAYGEIASSLYIALGIVAAQALGLTPLVLLVTGAVFVARLALVRGGDGGAAGDRRRCDVRSARVQRPRGLRDRAGCSSSTS